MNDIKKWFTSKTIIAAALGMVITVLTALGVKQAAGIDANSVADNVVNITQGVLYLIALWGRATATTKITA